MLTTSSILASIQPIVSCPPNVPIFVTTCGSTQHHPLYVTVLQTSYTLSSARSPGYLAILLYAWPTWDLPVLTGTNEDNMEAIDEDYSVESINGRRPFYAFLNVRFVKASTGNRMYGVLKRALDGNLNIPHGTRMHAKLDLNEAMRSVDFSRLEDIDDVLLFERCSQ